MHPFHAAQQTVQTRQVDAGAVIYGRCDLRAYPYRHLAVVAGTDLPMPTASSIMIAVEILSQSGWELVSVAKPYNSVEKLVAFLRRTAPDR